MTFPKAGRYEVRFSYGKHPEAYIATLVTVRHKNGETIFRLNQSGGKGSFLKRSSDKCFQSLGYFEFPAGQWDAVEVSAKKGNISADEYSGSKGKYAVADSVQFLIAGTPQVRKKETKLVKSPGGEIVHVRITEYFKLSKRTSSDAPLSSSS